MEKTWVMSDRERKEYNKQLEEKRKMKQGGQTDGMVCIFIISIYTLEINFSCLAE